MLCGAGRDRTGYLLHAMQALSQVSYSPIETLISTVCWWLLRLGGVMGNRTPISAMRTQRTPVVRRPRCFELTRCCEDFV